VGEVVRLSAARLKPAQPSSLRFEPVETPKGYTFGFLHPQAGPASTQKVLLWVRGGDAVGAADVVARRLDPSEQEVAVQRTIEGALPRSEWDRVIVARTFEVNVRQALALSAVGVVISALGLWKARALWRERAAA
jgi:hypothetical protein